MKKFTSILLAVIMSLSIISCSGSEEAKTTKESESQESSVLKHLDALEKISDIIRSKFDNIQVSDGTVIDGSVLYITAGEEVDSESLGETVGDCINQKWFDYDYVLVSQYVYGYLECSILTKCDDWQIGYHLWFDNDGNIINDPDGEISESETEVETEENDTSETDAKPKEDMTMSQKNALDRANSYLKHSDFSYAGLIEQLEYEGFPTEDATYAADNCGADWNKQAAKRAQSYLDHSSFSRSGLIDQLIHEGFTAGQAEYGVTAVGY